MLLDWRTAYFQQATSDYEMLVKLLAEENIPQCQRLHYLQMTTQKLAKGFLTPPGGPRYGKVHDAFAKFVKKAALLTPDLQRACGFEGSPAHVYANYLKGLRDLAQAVEDLSPEGGDHPNPEYPWKQNDLILSPLDHTFSGLDLRQPSPKMDKLLKFIAKCFTIA